MCRLGLRTVASLPQIEAVAAESDPNRSTSFQGIAKVAKISGEQGRGCTAPSGKTSKLGLKSPANDIFCTLSIVAYEPPDALPR